MRGRRGALENSVSGISSIALKRGRRGIAACRLELGYLKATSIGLTTIIKAIEDFYGW
jgi:hypothetical protein